MNAPTPAFQAAGDSPTVLRPDPSPVNEVLRTKSVAGYAPSDSSSAFASLRSVVSKPSVNQP